MIEEKYFVPDKDITPLNKYKNYYIYERYNSGGD